MLYRTTLVQEALTFWRSLLCVEVESEHSGYQGTEGKITATNSRNLLPPH